MTTEEILVPLNDANAGLRRNTSFGSNKDLTVEHAGDHDSIEYRLHAVHSDQKKRVSLWHDINLIHIDHTTKKSTNCLNFVCEIPKFTRYVVLSPTENIIAFCLKYLLYRSSGHLFGLNILFSLLFLCSVSFPRKKFEIATDEEGTPIKQDTKKGMLREVSSLSQQ
jgi:inorganic pyrophosphatase